MSQPNPFLPDLNPQALSAAMGDAWKGMPGLTLPPPALAELQRDYVAGATALWNQTLQSHGAGRAGPAPRCRTAASPPRNGRPTRRRPTRRRCTC